MFIGYPLGQKGWYIYDLNTMIFSFSWDVLLLEHVFSTSNVPLGQHACTTSLNDNVLPMHPSIYDDEMSWVGSGNALISSSHVGEHVLGGASNNGGMHACYEL